MLVSSYLSNCHNVHNSSTLASLYVPVRGRDKVQMENLPLLYNHLIQLKRLYINVCQFKLWVYFGKLGFLRPSDFGFSRSYSGVFCVHITYSLFLQVFAQCSTERSVTAVNQMLVTSMSATRTVVFLFIYLYIYFL